MLKHAKNHKYALEVPDGCVELTEEEQYYGGGWLNFLAGVTCSIISVVCTAYGKDELATAFALAGAVLSLGGTAMTINAGVKVAQGIATVAQETKFGVGIATSILDIGVSMSSTYASYGITQKRNASP